jgi:hypothetical protein
MVDVKEFDEAIPDQQGVGAGDECREGRDVGRHDRRSSWQGHRPGLRLTRLGRPGPSWQHLVVRHLRPGAQLTLT